MAKHEHETKGHQTMTALTKAEQRISEILEQARGEYEKVTDELNGYEIQKKNAAEAMSDAQDRTDLEAYNQAREQKQTADIGIEMLEGRLDKLETRPLISEKEYHQICDAINGELQALTDSTKKDLIDLTDQIVNLRDSYSAELRAADQAIKTLQIDIYRGRDLQEVRDGQIVRHSEKKAATRQMWALVEWADRMSDSEIYKEAVRARGDQ